MNHTRLTCARNQISRKFAVNLSVAAALPRVELQADPREPPATGETLMKAAGAKYQRAKKLMPCRPCAFPALVNPLSPHANSPQSADIIHVSVDRQPASSAPRAQDDRATSSGQTGKIKSPSVRAFDLPWALLPWEDCGILRRLPLRF